MENTTNSVIITIPTLAGKKNRLLHLKLIYYAILAPFTMSLLRSTSTLSTPDLTASPAEERFAQQVRKRKQPEDPVAAQIATLMEKMTTWQHDIEGSIQQISKDINDVIKTELSCLSERTSSMQTDIVKLRSEYSNFKASIDSVKKQQLITETEITNIKTCLEFQASGQEDLKHEITVLSAKSSDLSNRMEKVDNLEYQVYELRKELNVHQQRERLLNLEVVGIPEIKNENLEEIVIRIAHHAGVTLSAQEIDHAVRVQPRQPIRGRPRVIIVKLKTRFLKDNILSGMRKCRGITTGDIQFPGEPRRLFVNEHLTVENKTLLKKVKTFASAKLYQYVWIKNCQILLRKNDTSPPIHIRDESDLKKIV